MAECAGRRFGFAWKRGSLADCVAARRTFGPRSEAGGPYAVYVRTLRTFGPRSEAEGPHAVYVWTLRTFGPRSEAGGPHAVYVRTLRTFGPRSEARDRTDACGFYSVGVRRGPFGRGGRRWTTCETRGEVRRGASREGCVSSGARCAGFLLHGPHCGWGSEWRLDARGVQWSSRSGRTLHAAARRAGGPSAGRDGSNPSPRYFRPGARTARNRELLSGEGGIRTLGRLLTYARLASGYLRPLGHLSGFRLAAPGS
jgi:hypothetical protein